MKALKLSLILFSIFYAFVGCKPKTPEPIANKVSLFTSLKNSVWFTYTKNKTAFSIVDGTQDDKIPVVLKATKELLGNNIARFRFITALDEELNNQFGESNIYYLGYPQNDEDTASLGTSKFYFMGRDQEITYTMENKVKGFNFRKSYGEVIIDCYVDDNGDLPIGLYNYDSTLASSRTFNLVEANYSYGSDAVVYNYPTELENAHAGHTYICYDKDTQEYIEAEVPCLDRGYYKNHVEIDSMSTPSSFQNNAGSNWSGNGEVRKYDDEIYILKLYSNKNTYYPVLGEEAIERSINLDFFGAIEDYVAE